MIAARYEDVRHDYILVHHEPERGALHVLLRVAGAESPGTEDRLRALGAVPECSANTVSWRVDAGDIGRSLRAVSEALGPAALFDAGTSFDPDAAQRRSSELPAEWPGRYVVHVGGTRRCLVLDRATAKSDIAAAFRHAEADYFANDFHPATE